MNDRSHAILGALIALGLILGGWALGAQIKATRLSDRYVTVKGLVERQVKSDLAVWPISFKLAGNELSPLHSSAEAQQKTVLDFLAQQGIKSEEVGVGVVRVIDTQAREYGAERSPYRYIVEQKITVRSSRVDQVAAAAQKTALLLQKGIVIDSDRGGQQGVTYKFTGLNAIKPDMITEATRNARAAAARFAADSGSQVGSIRQANQGVFSILAADQAAGSAEEGFDYNADGSILKTVRVVTTVQYYLDQ